MTFSSASYLDARGDTLTRLVCGPPVSPPAQGLPRFLRPLFVTILFATLSFRLFDAFGTSTLELRWYVFASSQFGFLDSAEPLLSTRRMKSLSHRISDCRSWWCFSSVETNLGNVV